MLEIPWLLVGKIFEEYRVNTTILFVPAVELPIFLKFTDTLNETRNGVYNFYL